MNNSTTERLAEALKPATCPTCEGRGEIGGPTGQTPDNFEYVTEPCPDCAFPVKRIAITICQQCLDGIGEMCHNPHCALCRHKVDLPIMRELYEELPLAAHTSAPSPTGGEYTQGTWMPRHPLGGREIYPDAHTHDSIAVFNRQEDCDRAIACVNACAGMADPVAEIAKLRSASPWIAASPEGMPESGKRVLVVLLRESGRRIRTVAQYVAPFSELADLDVADESLCDEKDGDLYIKPGWYEWPIEAEECHWLANVTHWSEMPPLPAPPTASQDAQSNGQTSAQTDAQPDGGAR